MRCYHVYIMTNRSRTLYAGVTGNLVRRVLQHKTHAVEGFTSRYNIDRLVYYEAFANVRLAIAREKEIKGWIRLKKLRLIVSQNPQWRDLSADWYKEPEPIFARAKA
jgi:putative endonuclease